MRPWERQQDESAQAYRAARVYFDLGTDRTLAAVSARIAAKASDSEEAPEGLRTDAEKRSGSVNRWSRRFRWVERARAYDAHAAEVEDRARDAERASQATLLEQRRAKIADAGWLISQQMILKGLEMLRWPLATETVETSVSPDGRTIHLRTITPTNWQLRDAVRLLKFADDLARISVGIPNRVAVPGAMGMTADVPAVDQVQADADNDRISPGLAAAWLDLAAREALEHEGLEGAQPR